MNLKSIGKGISVFIQWLVLSSNDPAKLSLSVRGFLVGLIPAILTMLSAACGFGIVCLVGVDATWLNRIVDLVINIINGLLGVVAATMMIYGMLRKVFLTATGTNKVLMKASGLK